MHPPKQAVHPLNRFSIKTRYLFHENISPAFRAGDMFFIKYGEIRMWIEGPGGAFIDQFKNWSIL